MDDFRMHNPPTGVGNATTTNSQGEFDTLQDQKAKDDWGGSEGPNQAAKWDFTQPDQWGDHAAPPSDPIGSAVRDPDSASSTGLGTEDKLRKQDFNQGQKKPQTMLGRDPYSRHDEDAFEGSDVRGLSDEYRPKGDYSAGQFGSIV